MSLHTSMVAGLRAITAFLSLYAALPAQAVTPLETGLTDEIVFGSNYLFGTDLYNTSNQLGNAVAIYEYVRNNFEYATYHGSRSGSINTFNAKRGSDVDIASALIAMLRNINIPSRYAAGTIQLPAAQLINWLGMNAKGNINVAVSFLQQQGIQNVSTTTDASGNITAVSFEHVWVEALVPFAQYRGLPTATAVDCTQPANGALCNWVPLDASFKQMAYNNLNIDPYTAINFDYTAYYGAIANGNANLQNKNPLTILEEQIAPWLRTNYPGKTLGDVADKGQIIQVHDGLLPASLPYGVISNIRTYDSVALHDAAVANPPTATQPEPKKWAKYVTVAVNISPKNTSGTVIGTLTGSSTLKLAQLNLMQLALTSTLQSSIPTVTLRGPSITGGSTNLISSALAGYTPAYNDPYTITLSMDGAPDYKPGGSNDQIFTVPYNAIIGGYYLIATGGDSSNWTQVNNAVSLLLNNVANTKIVFNPAQLASNGLPCSAANSLGCTPYVDLNNNGVYQATTTATLTQDPRLLDWPTALDQLTGGLLYVAANQYYANLRDKFDRADHLMRCKTPLIGFLGVVSATYGAEYVNGTAFSILPDGLLIDMKGIELTSPLRTNDAAANVVNNYSNRQFQLLGHITSSLEHETWQELTGYDALSTVRGIQMALASPVTPPDTLVDVQNIPASTATTLDVTDFYAKMTASSNAPATAYPLATINKMKTTLLSPPAGLSAEYQLPSTMVTTPFNYFSVDILSEYSTSSGILSGMLFEIQNTGTH